jgi:hypothetical protein
MGCAQCHSHKYDPITQTEYYRVLAVFNNTADADRGDEAPVLEQFTPDQRRAQRLLDVQIQQLQQRPAASTAAADADRPAALAKLRKQREAIRAVRTPIMRELRGDQRRTTYVHLRGNFLTRGEPVAAGVPEAWSAFADVKQPDRLAFARWLVDPRNPLTPRVTVNRFWEQLFGLGLVRTSEDFGTQGDPPTHPQLLDYLASDFIHSGWDVKHLLRCLVTSATYRQSSRATEQKRQLDPDNRWLSRGPSFRLSGEMIRDQALAVAGLLSRRLHGPSVRPPRPALGLRAAFGGSTDWQTSPGEDKYRRGLYTRWRRTTPYPALTTFDAPSREVCTIRRLRTNTPLQALVTLNDPVFIEAAQGLARRIVREGGDSVASRIDYGFRLCLVRSASETEHARLAALYDEAARRFQASPEMARQLAIDPLGPSTLAIDEAELAAWTLVSNVLLNLDEWLAKK